jgi:hypothetical protein
MPLTWPFKGFITGGRVLRITVHYISARAANAFIR